MLMFVRFFNQEEMAKNKLQTIINLIEKKEDKEALLEKKLRKRIKTSKI